MNRIFAMAATLIFAAASFAVPASAELIYLKSDHSGRYVGTVNGDLAANASNTRNARKFDMIRLSGNRVAFRDVENGTYVRAGAGPQTLLRSGSPHIRGWETFRISVTPNGAVVLRSEQNGKMVRAGYGQASLLAAVSEGAPRAWERFRIEPAATGRPAAQRPGVSSAVAGSWRVSSVAAHQTSHLTRLAPRLSAASQITIRRDGGLRATIGCNTMNTRVSQNGADWNANAVMSTRMACPDGPLMAAESSVAKAIEDGVRVSLHGRTMSLRDAFGNTVLVLTR